MLAQVFQGSKSFVQLALPAAYPLRCASEVIHQSRICALLFMIDFCTFVADLEFTWCQSEGIRPVSLAGAGSAVYSISSYFPFGKSFRSEIRLSTSAAAKKVSCKKKYGRASKKIIMMTFQSIVILVDRIACSVCGNARKEHPCFRKYLVPSKGGSKPPLMTSWHQADVKFTDGCCVNPLTPNDAVWNGI